MGDDSENFDAISERLLVSWIRSNCNGRTTMSVEAAGQTANVQKINLIIHPLMQEKAMLN